MKGHLYLFFSLVGTALMAAANCGDLCAGEIVCGGECDVACDPTSCEYPTSLCTTCTVGTTDGDPCTGSTSNGHDCTEHCTTTGSPLACVVTGTGCDACVEACNPLCIECTSRGCVYDLTTGCDCDCSLMEACGGGCITEEVCNSPTEDETSCACEPLVCDEDTCGECPGDQICKRVDYECQCVIDDCHASDKCLDESDPEAPRLCAQQDCHYDNDGLHCICQECAVSDCECADEFHYCTWDRKSDACGCKPCVCACTDSQDSSCQAVDNVCTCVGSDPSSALKLVPAVLAMIPAAMAML